jgi:hypothetical protein
MQTNLQTRPANGTGATQKAKRMLLSAIVRGKVVAPLRVLVYGTEGVGKSTFAAGAPSPIFLCGEEGTNHLDVARFPKVEQWTDALDAIRVLRSEPHEYKTLVIDTYDSLESPCWAHVSQAAGKRDIEDFGYGKGYVAAFGEWQHLFAELEALRRERGMIILTIAHAQIRSFKNPAGADYDRYTLKVHEKAAGLAKEWHDVVLFARHEEYVRDESGRAKGFSTGARVVHTVRSAAWDAKNRFDLPETLPLNWEDFAQAVAAREPGDPAKLREEIAALAAALQGAPPELFDRPAFEKALAAAANDAAKLAQIKDRLSAKLAQKEG